MAKSRDCWKGVWKIETFSGGAVTVTQARIFRVSGTTVTVTVLPQDFETMTDDDKQARIRRLTKLTTDAELLKRLGRHRLPATIEQIERGEKCLRERQRPLFSDT